MIEGSTLNLSRVTVGVDGRATIDAVELPLSPWSRGVASGLTSELLHGEGVYLRHLQEDNGDWRLPAGRQIIVVLEGESVLETEDGSRLHLIPGIVFLMESGDGRHRNSLGPSGLVAAVVPLDGQV